MAETAFQIQYRQEFVAGFEQHTSLLRSATTTEAVIKGNIATFLVADSGGATAVTRGVNGLIPARGDNLDQPTATLVEWHDLVRKTGFNVFASQGNQREIMQKTTMAVINRKIDQDILGELAGTSLSHAAHVGTLANALIVKTALGNNEVPFDGNICAVITPAYEASLMSQAAFTSADYTSNARGIIDNADAAWRDQLTAFRWLGINWIVHPNLTGSGSAAASCFMFHKNAIGHAVDSTGIKSPVGFDEEQDYSWARCSVYMGSSLLQGNGVIEMIHLDDSFALA